MRLDLQDINISARISHIQGERIRLTIDYPASPYYRNLILCALVEILRPKSDEDGEPKE